MRVLSSPKFAPVAGPEHGTLRRLHAAAQAAVQGKGMNEHLVANVARWDRAVENWRHRFCSRAPLSLLGLEANAAVTNVDGRHQLTSGFVGLRFCLAVVTPGGNDKPAVPRSTM